MADSDSGTTALMYAVLERQYDIAKVLLKHGAHVNAQDEVLGKTALGHTLTTDSTGGQIEDDAWNKKENVDARFPLQGS